MKISDIELTKETINDIILEFTNFSEKISMNIDKPDKYLIRQNPLITFTEIFNLLKSFVSEIIINFDFFISTETMRRAVQSDEERDDNYLKLEKEQQRYEQKIRDQIRIEQQLKLHSESIQQKQDEKVKYTEDQEKSLEDKIEVRSYKKTYIYKQI